MMAHYEIDKLTKNASSNSGEFTLYVNNLPNELNEHGLMQIFNHYGYVKGHFYRPNASWAFITYNTYQEAENAIKDLHDVLPLRLKVSFAREKASNEIQFPKGSDSEHVIESHDDKSIKNTNYARNVPLQAKGRGKLLDIVKKAEPGLPTCTYTTDNDLLYPYPPDPYTYNPYENTDPYGSTNALWTRGQLTITQDGKRHVSLGRGYTMYEVPYPEPEIQNHIQKVYEKRTNGLYEYGRDTLQDAIGNCKKCLRKTKFTCERCHTYYCGRTCQISDWQQHKMECQSIPVLVPATAHSTPISRPNNEEQTPSRNITRVQVPLRQPKKLMNAITSSNENINTVTRNERKNNIISANANHVVDHKNEEEKKPTLAYNKINSPSKQVDNDKQLKTDNKSIPLNSISHMRKPLEKQNDTENSEKCAKKPQTLGVTDVKKIEEDIAFSEYTFLSKSKFSDVRIIIKSDREYWIQKVTDDNDLIQLMNDLQHEAENAQKVEATVGVLCAAQYENVWHRAMVTALDPLKVHYIDYGNVEIVKTNDLREINKFKHIPRFCAKIRLSEKANKKHKDLKYEDVISVKMISVDSNKVINVEVEGENDILTPEVTPTKTPIIHTSTTAETKNNKTLDSQKVPSNKEVSSPVSNLKSIVDTMCVGDIGILEIHAELSKNTYSITLLPHNAISDYEKLLNDLPAMCAEIADKSDHRPQIRDLICGQRLDGDWLRGYVLSLETPLKMATVDEARMTVINKSVPCSEKFLNICAFGAVCEIIDAKHKFNERGHYEFKVTAQKIDKKDGIEIELTKEQDTIKAVVKPWTPLPEQKGLQYAELKSGSEVCLTAFRSHTNLFARSLSTPELEHYNRIMQSVAKCAQTAPSLKELPVVGQMVIAQYTDDNYYRAIVTKVQDEKVAISYVDFGNVDITNIKKLKILSDDLKQLRSCTSKIVLKDVSQDVPMTQRVSNYLSCLVGTEVPLTCTFDGIPSKDGVYLKLHDGGCVNTIINEMIAPPTPKTAEEDKTCYMINDINVVSLGNVGDTIEVLVLHSIEDGYKYTVCPVDYDLITHVYDIMPKQMKTYCEASEYYIPREKELCLALYEGEWYRATCISRSETITTSSVFFIDYGNVENVDHKNIRLMPKDFITPDALASICNIINAGPTDSNGRYSTEVENKICKFLVPSECIKIKIIECDEEAGMYKVELINLN
ncbi:vreteno [Megachile rotundata]|uniref:vreteno n=1 Tax=Megachile rotundata TaxID=143995 RepID=UPI003FD45D9F